MVICSVLITGVLKLLGACSSSHGLRVASSCNICDPIKLKTCRVLAQELVQVERGELELLPQLVQRLELGR